MKKRWIAAGLAAVTACSVFISGCGDDKKAEADKIVRVAGTVSVSSSSMDPAKDGMAGTLSATVSVRRCLKWATDSRLNPGLLKSLKR